MQSSSASTGTEAMRKGECEVDVLLVDDMDVVRSSVRRLIHAKTTFRVVGEANDGRQALDLVYALRPAVVITDVHMPNMDGIALTHEIKRLYPHIHVLALTSSGDDETRGACAKPERPVTSSRTTERALPTRSIPLTP